MISKHEIAVIVKYAKTGTSVANRTKQKAVRDVMVVFVAFFFFLLLYLLTNQLSVPSFDVFVFFKTIFEYEVFYFGNTTFF
jgi:hypothetical protein